MFAWFANLRIGAKSALAPSLAIVGLIGVAAGSILVFHRLTQDFRSLNETSFVHFVQTIAGCYLRGLHGHDLRKLLQPALQRKALPKRCQQGLATYPEGRGFNLRDCSGRSGAETRN